MKTLRSLILILFLAVSAAGLTGCGAGGFEGYSQGWPYPENISTVYVEMFDSRSFRRDYEYDLSDAICKQLELQTPYKIVSDRNRADTILSGEIASIGQSVLAGERQTGTALENEAVVKVIYTWKDLRTGKLLLENETVNAFASYSQYQNQTFEYAAKAAVNRAAEKIVESMQSPW